MLTVQQGQSVTIPFTYLDSGGNPVNVTNAQVAIQTPTGTTVASGLTPSPTGEEGSYTLTWSVPLTATLGLWRSEWSGTETGTAHNRGGQGLFNVIGALSPSLVLPQDVFTYTQKSTLASTNTLVQFLQLVIDGLTGELETFLKRPLLPTWFDEIQTLDEDQIRVFLKRTPVLSITAIYVNPDTPSPSLLDPNTYVTFPWGVVLADPTYQLIFRENAALWYGTVGGTKLEIQYQAGIDAEAHRAIKMAIIRAAARELLAVAADAQNIAQLRAGEMLNYQFSDKNMGGFTTTERKRLRRYRRRVAA